jgi:hypothetical protein
MSYDFPEPPRPGGSRGTPAALPPRPLEPGEALFIGGPLADNRKRLSELPDVIEAEQEGPKGTRVGRYRRSLDTPRGAAVYAWEIPS